MIFRPGPATQCSFADALHACRSYCLQSLCRWCRSIDKGVPLCVICVVEDVRYETIRSRKGNTLGRVDLSLTDDSTNRSFKLTIWGQTAEDRLKFSLVCGSIIALADFRFDNEIQVHGELVAYTPPGLGQFDWLHPIMQNELPSSQLRCSDLLAWVSNQPRLKAGRSTSLLPLRRRNLYDWSKSRRPGLANIQLHFKVTTFLPTLAAEIDASDCDGVAVKIQFFAVDLASKVAADFDHAVLNGVHTLEADIERAMVGCAYRGSIKRIALYDYSRVEFRSIVSTKLSSSPTAFDSEPRPRLCFYQWEELLSLMNTRGSQELSAELRVAVHASLHEVRGAGNTIADCIVAENFIPPLSAPSQLSPLIVPTELHTAFSSMQIVLAAPQHALDYVHIANDLMTSEEVVALTGLHEEVATALVEKSQHNPQAPPADQTQWAPAMPRQDSKAVVWVDDRAMRRLFLDIPADLVLLSLLRRQHSAVQRMDYASLCDDLLTALRSAALEKTDFLVILALEWIPAEEDGALVPFLTLEEIVDMTSKER